MAGCLASIVLCYKKDTPKLCEPLGTVFWSIRPCLRQRARTKHPSITVLRATTNHQSTVYSDMRRRVRVLRARTKHESRVSVLRSLLVATVLYSCHSQSTLLLAQPLCQEYCVHLAEATTKHPSTLTLFSILCLKPSIKHPSTLTLLSDSTLRTMDGSWESILLCLPSTLTLRLYAS